MQDITTICHRSDKAAVLQEQSIASAKSAALALI